MEQDYDLPGGEVTSSGEEKEAIPQTLDLLKKFRTSVIQKEQPSAIPTGFSNLDVALEGGLFAGFYVIGAISSLGKTTLIGQIADQIAAIGHDVLIFSLEMSHEELFAKSVSRLTGIINPKEAFYTREILNNLNKIKTASQTVVMNEAFSVYEKIAKHIYIYEGMGDISALDVQKNVENFVNQTQRKPVVIIDYIQILAPYSAKYSSDKQNIDKTVLELKRLSRDQGIPVIGISSLNRSSYDGPISMAAFKESGSIEYSADVLLGLQFEGVEISGFNIDEAKSKDPRIIELKLLKNRNGLVGVKKPFAYYPKYNLFECKTALADEDKSSLYSFVQQCRQGECSAQMSIPGTQGTEENSLSPDVSNLSEDDLPF